MKKTLILFISILLAITLKAQIADSLLIELEADTLKSENVEEQTKTKIQISIETDEDDSFDKEEEKYSDTTRFRIGNKKIIIVDDDEYTDYDFDCDDDDDDNDGYKGYWEGIELGLNNYFTSDFSTNLAKEDEYLNLNTNKSWEVNLNIAGKGFKIIEERLGLITGIGFQINNYRFDNNITLIPDSSVLSYYTDTINNFATNKLTVTYLSVPLLLEYQVPCGKKNRKFHVSAGITGGIKLGSHTKQKYKNNNKEYKDKIKEDFHLSPFRYGLAAKIGYDKISIYANYSLNTLFEKNKGPELYPFAIGIAFTH
ncbi:MAG: PorT family protein [Bacteroidales bacterium]|nr:PorT family protein [Bacteroidales bacterium]